MRGRTHTEPGAAVPFGLAALRRPTPGAFTLLSHSSYGPLTPPGGAPLSCERPGAWRCALSGWSNGRSRRAGADRNRWRARRWLQPSIVLLALGCVLLVAVAYQAHAAVRSHRATVDRLLTDYARTAAWNYGRQAETELRSIVEHLFHGALHDEPADFVRSEPPPTRLVLEARRSEDACQCSDLGELSDAARYTLRARTLEVLGTRISPREAAGVREAIAGEVRRGSEFRGREGLTPVTIEGQTLIAAYSRVYVPGDTVVYALFLEPAALEDAMRHALRGALLPEPLVGDIPPGELLSLRVDIPGGPEVFRSSDVFPERYVASEVVGGSGGALRASVGLLPAAAEHLVIGGLPRSRLPVLLSFLALATGLLVVAFLQLRREHELAAMRAGFVSSVSHELRTPLALQRVFLDTLRLGRVGTAEGREWAFENIDRETHRLTHLVDNVLRFAQADEGRLRLDSEPADLAEEIGRALADYGPLSDGAELRFDPGEEPVIVPVDRDAFRQVLLNLVENAVKYGPSGQTVTVTLRRSDEGARITVDDEGPGIPAEDREGIWEPFERGETARRSGKGGSGIGLAVVRDLVGLHGGTVIAEDAPGGGARFRVDLSDAHG